LTAHDVLRRDRDRIVGLVAMAVRCPLEAFIAAREAESRPRFLHEALQAAIADS